MPLPLELVLLRHGQSEGNVASRASRQGDNSHFTPAFRATPGSRWHLTKAGKHQAKAAGAWLREEGMDESFFDCMLTSDFTRAVETGQYLGFPKLLSGSLEILRERNWGLFDVLPHDERLVAYDGHLGKRQHDPFYWAPPGGESMAHVVERARRFFGHLPIWTDRHDRILVVCHGEMMWAFRVLLEHLTPREYARRHFPGQEEKIYNCHILHYRRRPRQAHYSELRSVCTYDPSRCDSSWQSINSEAALI